MAEILWFLICLCGAAIVLYFVAWALIAIIEPPARVVKLIYVLAVLILVYLAVVWIPWPSFSGGFGPPRRLR